MAQVSNPAIVAQASTELVRIPWMEFWRKFRGQYLAMGVGVFVIALMVIAILALYIVPFGLEGCFDYDALNMSLSAQYWFGADSLGRDIFSRILMGTRISLGVGFVSVTIGAIIGTMLGLLAGYYEGWWDRIAMRISDVLFAFSGILLAIDIMAILGNGMINVIFAVAVFSIPVFARLVRGNTPTLKHLVYTEIARSIDVSDWTTIMWHIPPGTISSIVVYFSMRIDTSIITATSPSFLGLGAQPFTPEWGAMLNEACADMVTAPRVAIFSSLVIFLTALAFNLLDDGLRNALDPKINRR